MADDASVSSVGTFYKCSVCGIFFDTMEAFVEHECASTTEKTATPTEISVIDELGTDTDNVENEVHTSTHCTRGYSATILLIETYRDLQYIFKSSAYKKIDAWKRVAKELQKQNYSYTADQCDKKMRSLKYRHKVIVDGNNKTGRGKRTWEFFDLIEDLQAGNPSVRPTITVSSLEGEKTKETTCSAPSATSTPSASESPSRSLASTSAETPSKAGRKRQAPEWFQQFTEENKKQLSQLVMQQATANEVAKERNEILKAILNKK